jgi:hypothetical protein
MYADNDERAIFLQKELLRPKRIGFQISFMFMVDGNVTNIHEALL